MAVRIVELCQKVGACGLLALTRCGRAEAEGVTEGVGELVGDMGALVTTTVGLTSQPIPTGNLSFRCSLPVDSRSRRTVASGSFRSLVSKLPLRTARARRPLLRMIDFRVSSCPRPSNAPPSAPVWPYRSEKPVNLVEFPLDPGHKFRIALTQLFRNLA